MNTKFKPSDFVKLIFETTGLVGNPGELDNFHDNPPRDLRIGLLKKAAEMWGIIAPLSEIATGKVWQDPALAARRVELLLTEFPPDPVNGKIRMDFYTDDLQMTTETLFKYRRKLDGPKDMLDGIMCGGGLYDVMITLRETTKRIQPELDAIDELLAKFLLPGAKALLQEDLPSLNPIKEADIENL